MRGRKTKKGRGGNARDLGVMEWCIPFGWAERAGGREGKREMQVQTRMLTRERKKRTKGKEREREREKKNRNRRAEERTREEGGKGSKGRGNGRERERDGGKVNFVLSYVSAPICPLFGPPQKRGHGVEIREIGGHLTALGL
jgi:hypothetical protein